MIDEVIRILDGLPIPVEDIGDEDVMRIIDNLPLPEYRTRGGDIDKQNECIEKLKVKIKELSGVPGTKKEVSRLNRQLRKEFKMLDVLLKRKLALRSKSKGPGKIIHLATTEEEDNLPPIMLYAQQNEDSFSKSIFGKSTVQQSSEHRGLSPGPSHKAHGTMHDRRSLSRERTVKIQDPLVASPPILPHDHQIPLQQRNAEKKFHEIQKKLLHLCSNDVRSKSTGRSDGKDEPNNLSDDVKKQFDILYSELKVLEKELFHGDNTADTSGCDSLANSKKQIETLRRQNAVLLEQGEHFQILFKEQQLEIENYRKKYMQTLQNVMEQHMRITSMESLSKFSEKKAYEEIFRMKNNLKKKLNHLAPMPNMLETCNNKLIHTIKRKTELEQNYQDISNELRTLKKELANNTAGTYKARCDSLTAELKKSKELNEFNTKRINQLQSQLQQAKTELERATDTSNKTIKSTIQKSDFLRSELKSRIDQLEVELAQVRANATANSK